MTQGDVWLADVLFKGTRHTKQRPVIIVGNELALDVDVIIAPVTSQMVRNQFDVVLEYWQRIIKTFCRTYFKKDGFAQNDNMIGSLYFIFKQKESSTYGDQSQ